jgi:hypothetical protein
MILALLLFVEAAIWLLVLVVALACVLCVVAVAVGGQRRR